MPQIVSGTVERSLVSDAFAGSDSPLSGKLASVFQITLPVEREGATYWMTLALIVSVGAVLRFWGLSSVGLHGDEETMAMAVRHILVDGLPTLPSGMFYPRGLTQLYLMAASVALFGESEWALRLPSVLCGIALIPLSYFASRRFLRPIWSLAFTASVAFLPTLILDSQTARMYIFLVTMVTACLVCLFAWERTDRIGWLAAAAAAVIIGLDMHSLAVATVLMFLLPGLIRGDIRRLLFGGVAALIGVVAFLCIDGWVNAQYPTPPAEFGQAFGPPIPQRSLVPRDFHIGFDLILWTAGLVAAFFAWRLRPHIPSARTSLAVVAAIVVGIGFQLALFYHLASVAYLVATVAAVRSNRDTVRPLAAVAVVVLGILVIHVALLAPVAGTFVRLVGALVGQPSVWPYVRIAEMSPYAGLATAALIAWGFYRLAHRERVTDFWLLAILGVWAPVFVLGLFAWNVPPRYTAMSLMPMLLCAFAASQAGADWLLARVALDLRAPVSWAVAIVAIATINPTAVVAAVNSKQIIFSDHKGAAEFIRKQNITEDDVLIAEDVLQQTYYLGKVDYWLVGPQVARRFVKKAETGVVDFYTGTPVIVTTAMLDEVLKQNRGKRIFVIGSGEDWRNGRRLVREEMHEALTSERFETVYKARDRRTRVLLAAPDAAAAAAAATSTKSGARRPAAIPAGMEPGSMPAMTE
jgi:4-amino-4-deoxy-L-arabinose transferase-like glycosyltransferase